MESFDVAAATAAYLAQFPPEGHAKALAYTRGGHWLLLWGALVSIAVAWLILRWGVLKTVADRLQRRRPRPLLVSFVLAYLFSVLSFVLSLPWSLYASWWREKGYGLNNQSWAAWLGEAAIGGALIGSVMFALLLMVIYALIRRAPRTWWLWSGGVTGLFVVLALVISPVLIEPIFNTYTEAAPGPVRDAVVQLARENAVPTDKVFVFDGSRQSDRYTANVSGLGGTARIAISDAMLKRATLPEVRGVVGHEIGHYAHAHPLWMAGVISALALVAFWLVDRTFGVTARLLGARDVRLSDPVGLPVLSVILSVVGLLATPVLNTLTRVVEEDADRYSLERAREPDGLAAALVKTIEYRAASPGALEEFVFYSHPSVENRVRRAMEWKAARLTEGTGEAGGAGGE